LITGNLTGAQTWTLPDATGTVILSGHTFTGDVTATLDTDGSTALTVAANSLDYSELEDTLNLDASTSMVLGAFDYDINLDSTGEFAIQDGGGDVFLVDANGKSTFYDDVDYSLGAGEDINIAAAAAPTSDMMTITNSGYGATASADGMSINYTAASDAASGDTNMGINVAMTGSGDSGDTLYGVNIAGLTGTDATEYALVIGTGWDKGMYVQSASEFTQSVTYSGSGRPTRQITLSPEYEGASLTGDGSSNVGTMTSDFCAASAGVGDIAGVNTTMCNTSGDLHSYYNWTTAEGTSQDYDVWIRWRVPDNFDSWADSNPVNVYGKRTDATNNAVTVYVYDTNGTLENTGGTQVAGTSWAQTSVEASFAGTYTAGDYMTIQVHMTADTGGDSVQVGEISLDYLTNN
ncbi:MAG: hypothetical protein U1C49_00705, partial [Candidatus Andersenbacteria bacterium]|nr:hypothetical protein [bacterium]MDZ4225346.1 hypothetical protein [Candidatus Andersenbacteria bacterium]